MCKHILLLGLHIHDWTPTDQPYADAGARCSHTVKYDKPQEVIYDDRFCQCNKVVKHDPQAGGRPPGLPCVENVLVPCAKCIEKESWAKNFGGSQRPIEGEVKLASPSRLHDLIEGDWS